MEDLFHSLLGYLNLFPVDYAAVNINNFLTQLGYSGDSIEDAKTIKGVIIALANQKFIECDTNLFDELFAEIPLTYNPTTNKHDIPIKHTFNVQPLSVHLTPTGKIYIENRINGIRQSAFLERQTAVAEQSALSLKATNSFSRRSTIISIALSLIVITVQIYTCKQDNNRDESNELERLNENSDQLISIEMQYPYVIDSVYIESWSKHPHSEDDSSNRYQSYCEALFDYMEKTCEYYNYDKKKLDNYIDIPSVIGMHKFWWLMPDQQTTDDSVNSPDFYKFRDYINTFYK